MATLLEEAVTIQFVDEVVKQEGSVFTIKGKYASHILASFHANNTNHLTGYSKYGITFCPTCGIKIINLHE